MSPEVWAISKGELGGTGNGAFLNMNVIETGSLNGWRGEANKSRDLSYQMNKGGGAKYKEKDQYKKSKPPEKDALKT